MFRISTESEYGIKRRKAANVGRFVFAALLLLWIVLSLIVLFWKSIIERNAVECFPSVFCLLVCTSVLFLCRPEIRGFWELDSEGISFTAINGVSYHLKWANVNAIRFRGKFISFRGSPHIPPIPLSFIDNEESRAVVSRFVRENIAHSIDLSEQKDKPIRWQRMLFCLVLGLFGGGLPLGIIYSQAVYLPPGSEWVRIELLLFMTSLLALVFLMVIKEDLKKWHIKRENSETGEYPAKN